MSETNKLADIKNDNHRYDDIIDLPRPFSKTHAKMPLKDRSAQFAPFSALTGHDKTTKEAARLTETRRTLEEDSQAELNETLQLIVAQLSKQPSITTTYFVPDGRKTGGAYVTLSGKIKKIDEMTRMIVLEDGTKIPIDEMIDLQYNDFSTLFT